MTRPKTPAPAPAPAPPKNVISIIQLEGQSTANSLAQAAIRPNVNAALVVHAYQDNLLGRETGLDGLAYGLTASMDRSKGGDLSTLEDMLIGQATALQTIFTSLAKRAQVQTSQRNLEAFLGLALKAQAQSRATITALVDLKHPKQAMFVKQANIANGPQQVNNGVPADPERSVHAHVEENKSPAIKLLEAEDGKFGKGVDAGAAAAPARGHPAMETLVQVHRAKVARRQTAGTAECLDGRAPGATARPVQAGKC